MVVNALILNMASYVNVMHHILESAVKRKQTCANIQHANIVSAARILVLMSNAHVYPDMGANTVTQVRILKINCWLQFFVTDT